ncbi:hypothetical protein [Azohydromonas lata]|uniref:hypothetical protein n=1 Tax=Azohydromonas lata TaxID=45677 RepID=UPI0012F4CEAC|nr:hypothetical protein [Azohydromonas lata]
MAADMLSGKRNEIHDGQSARRSAGAAPKKIKKGNRKQFLNKNCAHSNLTAKQYSHGFHTPESRILIKFKSADLTMQACSLAS